MYSPNKAIRDKVFPDDFLMPCNSSFVKHHEPRVIASAVPSIGLSMGVK